MIEKALRALLAGCAELFTDSSDSAELMEKGAVAFPGAEVEGDGGILVRQRKADTASHFPKPEDSQIGGKARQAGGLDQFDQGLQVVLDQVVRVRILLQQTVPDSHIAEQKDSLPCKLRQGEAFPAAEGMGRGQRDTKAFMMADGIRSARCAMRMPRRLALLVLIRNLQSTTTS